MVKFNIEKKTILGRLGKIESWGSVELEHETPSFMTYLRSGHIPHLTWEVANKQLKLNQKSIYQLTLPSLVNSAEIIEKFTKGVGKFCGIPSNSAIHLSIHDPLAKLPGGYNDSKSIAIWTKNGKYSLNVSKLKEIINWFGCDSFETLCDYDLPKDSGNKKHSKSSDRTRIFNEQMFESCEKAQGSAIITLGGGFNSFYRKKCSIDIGLKEHAAGYSIEFHDFVDGNEVDEEEMAVLLKETFSPLPPTKIRIVSGAFDPKRVLTLIKCGIDLFDSSYPIKCAEQGKALYLTDDFPNSSNYDFLDFNNEKFSDDFTKPFENCECYTCQKYTKGYLQHLVNTKELLAPLLLVIHNMTEYDRMFKLIRNSLLNKEGL